MATSRRLRAAGLLVVSGIGLLLVFQWIFPAPRFPEPTGPHRIGTRIYEWMDRSRHEPFTATRSDVRRLVVQIWYPATVDGPKRVYLDSEILTAAIAEHFGLPASLLHNLRNAPTHAVTDAPAEQGRFPVLINPGGYHGFRTASLVWIEELVSHGYVVVGLDQPGTSAATLLGDGTVVRTMADRNAFDRLMPLALSARTGPPPHLNGVPLPGGIIPFLSGDLSFVLDRLAKVESDDSGLIGRLDLERVGVFGMSLGSYVGIEACRRDLRFRACLAVDSGHTDLAAVQGISQPLMIMSRDADVMREERRRAGGWPEPEIEHTVTTQRALFAHSRGDVFYVTMNDMFHVNWTDVPIWSPLIRWIGVAGPVDPYQAFATTNAFTLAFFDRYLKDGPPLHGEKLSAGRPIRVETRPGR